MGDENESVDVHGVSVGSQKVDSSELSSSDHKPLRGLGSQAIRHNMPKGLGRSVAKKLQYEMKAKLKPKGM
jgi:hypothetical protein